MAERTLGGVLSIAKLRVGQEAYTLAGVAQSLDDYYTGVGEAAGRWHGVGASRLGLGGEVDPDDLRAVLAGLAPGSGGLTPDGETVRTHARRVPGFDLTFKAPKSVSVLYAVSDDPRVQGAILDAGETALASTLAWLEREAINVRRGSGDAAYLNDLAARDPDAADAARVRVLPGRGIVAAAFRHRTSRAGDPLLHWHTLIANMVEGPDGRWSAFVHPDLYRAGRVAGEVFQAALRAELTERLGLEWRPGRHVLEVAGVPQRLCDRFSKRSAEIEAWLEANAIPSDHTGRQAAVLATRRGKPEVEDERYDAAWKAEATEAGWGPADAEHLIGSCGPRVVPGVTEVWRLPTEVDGVVIDRTVDPEEWTNHLLRDLTEHDSTFTRAQLVQAAAARIGEGVSVTSLDRVVARVMASDQVVPVSGDGAKRWTATEVLRVERSFLDMAARTQASRSPVPGEVVDRTLSALPALGEDQAAAVRGLAASCDGLSVMVGPAGTGKTFTLDAVRQVFMTAGFQVVGAAPSAKAAHELAEGAGIPASTIHRLTGSWERGFELPDARTVMVVDEAAMAGIRDLEHLVSGVLSVGGRVLLVGDHHQLPEVTAGGGFAAVALDPRYTVVELTENRRQTEAWERAALAELRDGHVAQAVAGYRDHDRVVVTEDRASMVDAGVQQWLDAHRSGQVPVLLAGTNEMVDALSMAVRRALLDGGVLGDPVEGSAGSLAIGERLMIRVNDYRAHDTNGRRTAILNGQTGTLTGACDSGLVVRMDRDRTDVIISNDTVAAGAIGYAYASTAHRAQGGTWDLAITVGLDGLYREAGYLVMSRGRAANWLVVSAPEAETLDAELDRHDSPLPLSIEMPDSVDDELVDALSASRRKLLALTRDPNTQAVQHAAARFDLVDLEAVATRARQAEHAAGRAVGADPARMRDRLARTIHTAGHITVGTGVKAWDRRNIGTVTDLDDRAGSVTVEFMSANGRAATRTMAWGDVQIVVPRTPPRRVMTGDAVARLDRETSALVARIDAWDQHLAGHGFVAGDRHVYERASQLVIDRAAARLHASQPAWLRALLGARPPGPPAAVAVWDDAVADLAAHRTRHGITDPATPTGLDEPVPGAGMVWEAVSGTIAQARLWLDTHHHGPDLGIVRTRSVDELNARRRELDAIFATAPADHRELIGAVRAGGMLPLEDTAELLRDALAGQGERRRWILEHWPHVVEYAQITQVLDGGHAGPDVPALLDGLASSRHPHLAAAAGAGDRWLATLTAQLVEPIDTTVSPGVEQLLADVAGYRHRWGLTSPHPLGDGGIDGDQANEQALLTLAIDHALDSAGGRSRVMETTPPDQLLELHDGFGW